MPEAELTGGVARDVETVGTFETRSSRFADANMTSTREPAGIRIPAISYLARRGVRRPGPPIPCGRFRSRHCYPGGVALQHLPLIRVSREQPKCRRDRTCRGVD